METAQTPEHQPPRFFAPSGPPVAIPPPPAQARVVDRFLYEREPWVSRLDDAGHLHATREDAVRARGGDVVRLLNAHELAGAARTFRIRGIWLAQFTAIETTLDTPGINDSIELRGRLHGPFPSGQPFSWPGRLTVTRAELLDGLVRGLAHAFRVSLSATAEESVVGAVLPGGDLAATVDRHGVILAYPCGGDDTWAAAGNQAQVRQFFYALLDQMRAEQAAERPRRLAAAQVPAPDQAWMEARYRERGYRVQNGTAVRKRSGMVGRFFPERVAVAAQGTARDFAVLSQVALGEAEGWPSARCRALAPLVEAAVVRWTPDLPDGVELVPGQEVTVDRDALVSARPKKAVPGEDRNARVVAFRVDAAFAAHARDVTLEYEFQDVRGTGVSATVDSQQDARLLVRGAPLTGSGEWRRVKADVDQVAFRRRGPRESDVCLQIVSPRRVRIREVVLRARPRAVPAASTTPHVAPPVASASVLVLDDVAPVRDPATRTEVSWSAHEWEPIHQVRLEVEHERLVITSTGNDPHLQGPRITIPCPVEVVLRMSASTGGHAEVFCHTTHYPHYEMPCARLDVPGDGQTHEYRARLWELGTITRLRLDPCNAPGTFVVHGVLLVPVPPPDHGPAPTSARVAYYDPLYPAVWGSSQARAAERLEKMGFTIVSARELAAWMGERTRGGAPGSVCVMTQDLFPAPVFDSNRPDCTARRYLDAGGRIVHAGHFPFSHRAWADGTHAWIGSYGLSTRAIPCPCADGAEAPVLTNEGRAFGLTQVPASGTQLTTTAHVDVVLTRAGRFQAGAWLKTFSRDHPGSGLLHVSSSGVDGRNDGLIEELARVAQHGLPR
ncbi:MAG: hypothetical protein HY904_22245 [Deltaproteobacteria bacterium]|nr:hypothetical protein [Deltaproteobacteria bacterium]